MITLGIDLAAEPKATGGCSVEWREGRAFVRWVETFLHDDEILKRAGMADAVGIDAPFGWPRSFVEAITAHDAGRRWPVDAWEKGSRRRLRLRATDEWIRNVTGITPLSVSSDMIAIPAMRCASLLDRLGVRDRSGDDRVFEVYPAAALWRWGLPHRGYKNRADASALPGLLAGLKERAPWLRISPLDERTCASRHDAFDALVASLVARAATKGLTRRPTVDELAAARVEGWIALPEPGTLATLP